MWFLTVRGQIALGLIGVTLGVLVLTGMKLTEDKMKQDHQGQLLIVTGLSGPDEDQLGRRQSQPLIEREVGEVGLSAAPGSRRVFRPVVKFVPFVDVERFC